MDLEVLILEAERITHPFAPVWNQNSKILILGSLPSVKSRENNFYYGHPRNRFWKVLAGIFEVSIPETIEEKTDFILGHQLAIWDVIESCQIQGSSDSSIREVKVNDLEIVLRQSNIHYIICNGKAAEKFFMKYQYPEVEIKPIVLPSTSPANAAYSLERLISVWKPAILNLLNVENSLVS